MGKHAALFDRVLSTGNLFKDREPRPETLVGLDINRLGCRDARRQSSHSLQG